MKHTKSSKMRWLTLIGYPIMCCLFTGSAAAQQMPDPNSITAQLAKPWAHKKDPVSDQKFAQDKAKCATKGHMAPVNGWPSQIRFLFVFLNCMKAAGYEPDDSPDAPQNRYVNDVH